MQRAFQKLRALRALALGFAFVAGVSAASCSSDSKNDGSSGGTGGGSGAGGTSSQKVETIQCGANSCDGQALANIFDPLKPCCAEGDACGLDSTFLSQYGVMFSETCQLRDQPGVPGAGCPDSAELHVPGQTLVLDPLKGCCRTATHTCGYQLDSIVNGLIPIGLGCIDSSPFLDGGTATSCDPAGGEAGGGAGGGG
ncbi:MAG TPA: hypothetical protein VGQ57_06710 [Polyangiaceae bacterium]|jgi:hypothetical protein|nr:hypothetical protein [Polyangiaceae bacterium]